MLQYILECIAFQLVFLIIYDVFLKRETFFQWNRLYLIGTYIISMVLPWVKIEAMKSTVPESFQAYPEFLWNMNDAAVVATAPAETVFSTSWEYTLLFSGMFISALFFGYKLYQIYALKQKGEVQYFKDFTRIIIANSSMAFSFFKSIFLGDKVIERDHENILQHELVHIRQRHSYDLIFFEFMRIVGWFNPLVYVYQSRVSELHEFIADSHVAKTNKKEQYQLLLSEVFQTQQISFINQFFKTSLIKKRIVMLQKTKSKKIWKLKYLLLVPLVFGMLAYTSSSTQSLQTENSIQISYSDDTDLNKKVKARIEKEINQLKNQGNQLEVLKRVNSNHPNRSHIADSEGSILSKEDYFESAMLFRMTMQEISKKMAKELNVEMKDYSGRIPLPSTARYKSYVSRKKAFQILDENLKFSIMSNEKNKGYDVRQIDNDDNYSDKSYELEVNDVRDLTGKEIAMFNNKMDEIFKNENSVYSSLVLKDMRYRFQVFGTKPMIAINTWANVSSSNEKGQNDLIKVRDIENLSLEEENKIFDRLKVLQESEGDWSLTVVDGKASMQFVPANDGSYLSGPNGEKIASKLIYDSELNAADTLSIQEFIKKNGTANFRELEDITFTEVDQVPIFPGCENEEDQRACFQKSIQKHIDKNFRYPKEAQEKGIQGRVSIMFKMDTEGSITNVRMRGPDKLLEDEAARIIGLLPRVKPGIHNGKKVNVLFSIPITFKLNSYSPDYQILPEIGASDGGVIKSIRQYNQLVAERNRLLQSSNKTNPIIVNLDQQLDQLLEAIKTKIQQSDTTQKELEVQFLKILKEREKLKINQSQLETEHVPFSIVENVPVFPGCADSSNKRACFNKKMQEHIGKNFRYPEIAQEKGIQGRVSMLFTISKDGTIQNVKMRGPDALLEKEAARIIGRLPKMTPGKHKGKAVNVPFSIPITFKLQIDDKVDLVKHLSFMSRDGVSPMFIVDEKESSKDLVEAMLPDDIETISILKGKVGEQKWGDKGKNGVVEITTKKKD